ncbi:MAG: hypothetical protein KKD36_11760 [Bacteroidetes bacterium]|nr:hypothetical protein [Bacteroidota bacterium]
MTFHNVITHQSNRIIEQPHFFILSKGKNAGKPLKESCPNCFLVTVKDEEESEHLYWIAYILWKSDFWHQYQIGSVISFIRIDTFKTYFRNEVIRAYKKHLKHLDFVNRLRQLETLQQHYSKTIEQIEKLKWALLQNQLR